MFLILTRENLTILGKPCFNEYESNLHNVLILRITPLTSRAGTRLTPPSNEILQVNERLLGISRESLVVCLHLKGRRIYKSESLECTIRIRFCSYAYLKICMRIFTLQNIFPCVSGQFSCVKYADTHLIWLSVYLSGLSEK